MFLQAAILLQQTQCAGTLPAALARTLNVAANNLSRPKSAKAVLALSAHKEQTKPHHRGQHGAPWKPIEFPRFIPGYSGFSTLYLRVAKHDVFLKQVVFGWSYGTKCKFPRVFQRFAAGTSLVPQQTYTFLSNVVKT